MRSNIVIQSRTATCNEEKNSGLLLPLWKTSLLQIKHKVNTPKF
jgi:hypothetical protein